MNKAIGKIIYILITLLFGGLCSYMVIDMRPILESWMLFLGIIIVLAYTLAMVILKLRNSDKIFKLGFMLLFVITILLGTFFVFFKMDLLELFKDVDRLREYIAQYQSITIAFILLQFAQVIFLPIPSTVTILLGVLLFNPINAVIYSLIGIIPGSIIMFLFGRYAGRKAVEWALGKEDVKKYLEIMKGKDNSILTTMFILPLFPDDLLCALAGITSMSFKFFSIMITITRIITVAISVAIFSGNFIPFTGYWLILWGVIFVGIISCAIYVIKNGDKVERKFSEIMKKFKKKKNNKKDK